MKNKKTGGDDFMAAETFVNFTDETAIKALKLIDQLLARQLSKEYGVEITVVTDVKKKPEYQ